MTVNVLLSHNSKQFEPVELIISAILCRVWVELTSRVCWFQSSLRPSNITFSKRIAQTFNVIHRDLAISCSELMVEDKGKSILFRNEFRTSICHFSKLRSKCVVPVLGGRENIRQNDLRNMFRFQDFRTSNDWINTFGFNPFNLELWLS
jgi:hypothetical protein